MYTSIDNLLDLDTYLLLPGGPYPRPPATNSPHHRPPPLSARRPTRIGASGPRLQQLLSSAQPAAVQPLHQPQERPLPGIPRQQPVNQPTAPAHDLARHLDQRRAERRELHPQQRPLLGLVLLGVPRRDRYQQGAPRLQTPC